MEKKTRMIPKGERQGEKKDRMVSSQPPRVFRISFLVLCKYSVSYLDHFALSEWAKEA